MHTQSITASTNLQAEQMIMALQKLDQDGKEAILSIIMTAARRASWIHDAIQDAITQQIQEQRELDDWIEREAAIDAARHGDPYASSKMGDCAYWTQ